MKDFMKNVISKVEYRKPEIFAAMGVLGLFTGGVMLCRAARNMDDILDETKDRMDKIHEKEKAAKENPNDPRFDYPEKEAGRDKFRVVISSTAKMAKLFGPALLVEGFSVVCFMTSNGELRKRCAASMATLATVDQSFRGYRDRVIAKYGEEEDFNLLHNVKEGEIDEIFTDEKGKNKAVKKKVKVADPNAEDLYSKYFTRSNPNWEDDDEIVECFFRATRSSLQSQFACSRRNHTVLNTAFDAYGFNQSLEGIVPGWVNSPDAPDEYRRIDDCITWHKIYLPGEDGKLEKAWVVHFNALPDVRPYLEK